MRYFENLNRWGDQYAAIEEDGHNITYNELDELCKNMGKCLVKRSLVTVFCENSIACVSGYISFLNNRIVPMLLDKDMDTALSGQLIECYKPRYLYMPEEMEKNYSDFKRIYKNRNYVLLENEESIVYQFDEELALLLTTSGSTGSAKFVRQSYKNISSNASTIASYLELSKSDRAITTLPMNYTYGLSIINSHLSVGAAILMTERSVIEKSFWDFLKKEKASSLNGVPYTYEILDKIRFFKMELPSLRLIVCGGGKLPLELHQKMAKYAEETGKKFVVRYGQTESTANMAYLPADKSAEKVGSMGQAIPGGRFALLDINNEIIEENEQTGELVYWGDNVAMGYARCPEDLEKQDEWQGYLVTGDMAKRDADGYYYIVGRKKRFLKIYGSRVNLDETERILHSKFPDLGCACTGKDDEMVIFITDKLYEEEVKKYLSSITKLNIKAFHIKYIQEIPKNNAGKTLYSALKF